VAGRIHKHRKLWGPLSTPWVLRVLKQGAPLLFENGLPPPRTIKSFPSSAEANEVISKWLTSALNDKEVALSSTRPRVISPIFAIPKKNQPGEFRVIVDLRYLNSFLRLKKFKLDSLPLALRSVTPNCVFTKTDLKSGFSHVKVAHRFRKYLGFRWGDQNYHYRVLPFGLASSPYLFSKMLLPAVQRLRQEGVKIFVYVDDILIVADSAQQCWHQTLRLRQLLSSLGWVVREDKSSKTPSTEILFLGFLINSRSMTLSLPPGKAHSVVHELRRFARRPLLYPRRVVAKFVGLAMSTAPAVPLAKAFCRRLMSELRQPGLPWNARILVSSEARQDFLTLADLISGLKPQPIVSPNPSLTIQTDASLTGYGAVLLETGRCLKGSWDSIDLPSFPSINFLELHAVQLALQELPIPPDSVVRLQSDNATAVAYLKNFSGRIPALHVLARSILELTLNKKITLLPVHIPGSINSTADRLSREKVDWELKHTAFRKMCKYLETNPQVDRFASSLNHKLPRFNSRWPHPRAEAVNSMTLDWTSDVNYWAPPVPLLDRTVLKIRTEKATGVLITPPWSRTWLPTVLTLADKVLRLPVQAFQPLSAFEMKSGFLLAWRISGRDSSPTSPRAIETWWSQIAKLEDWEKCSAP